MLVDVYCCWIHKCSGIFWVTHIHQFTIQWLIILSTCWTLNLFKIRILMEIHVCQLLVHTCRHCSYHCKDGVNGQPIKNTKKVTRNPSLYNNHITPKERYTNSKYAGLLSLNNFTTYSIIRLTMSACYCYFLLVSFIVLKFLFQNFHNLILYFWIFFIYNCPIV